jgi:glycosyltransferase involved in cell wall biosynthesis
MISVCMATHNGEKYLHMQLASILRQLGPEDEVVISDDSSTDGTIGIIRGFNDPRIHLLENNTFYSPIYNFEHTLQHVSGEIIALADQDDIWLDNKMEVMRDTLENKRGQPALIMMDGFIIDGDGNRTGQTIFKRKPPKKRLLANLYDNTFTGCSLAFTRELLEWALPFPQGIPMHDSWLGLTALLHGEVEFIETKTMEYRRHDANISRWQRNPLVQIRWRICLGYHLGQRSLKHLRMGTKNKLS